MLVVIEIVIEVKVEREMGCGTGEERLSTSKGERVAMQSRRGIEGRWRELERVVLDSSLDRLAIT